ncbi:MAG TPA: hypothetical protein VGN97_18065 [Mesorhizobium sp.]|nr:hypothetical protein [Mesorhizobium sp.]
MADISAEPPSGTGDAGGPAPRAPDTLPNPREGTGHSHWVERAVALTVAVWVVVLISFLILSQRPWDPTGVFFLKILLSFSMAVLAATSPGFVNLSFNLAGLAVRAGGAIAVFIFVFTQAPAVPALGLDEPKIEMNDIRTMDFRSLAGPGAEEMNASPVAVTVPVEVKKVAPASRTGTLKGSTVSFRFGDKDLAYQWEYFVTLLPGVGGTWLSSRELEPARATDLAPGATFSQEVMHLAQEGPSWLDFVEHLRAASAPMEVSVQADVDGGVQVKTCRFTPSRYRGAIEALESRQKRLPGYVSVRCER